MLFGFEQTSDPRDEEYPIDKLFGAAPTGIKYKAWKLPKLLDQRDSEMCVGFAAYHNLAAEPVVKKNIPDPIQIYDWCKEIDGLPDKKTTSIRAAMTALKNKGLIKNYYWAKTAEDVAAYVLDYGPVLFGCNWSSAMLTVGWTGRVQPGGASLGGHCTLVYGVDILENKFLIANSWANWGFGSCAEMHATDLHYLLQDGGVACAFTE